MISFFLQEQKQNQAIDKKAVTINHNVYSINIVQLNLFDSWQQYVWLETFFQISIW